MKIITLNTETKKNKRGRPSADRQIEMMKHNEILVYSYLTGTKQKDLEKVTGIYAHNFNDAIKKVASSLLNNEAIKLMTGKSIKKEYGEELKKIIEKRNKGVIRDFI